MQELVEAALTDRPGPEWFTTKEFREKFGLKPSAAQRRLGALLAAGKVERTVAGGNVHYYRVKR